MILSSCEALPPLSTPSLKELAKVVPYIIVQELPDSAAANARKRMASETVLKPVPNIFVSPLPGAYCHKLRNSMVRAMGEKGNYWRCPCFSLCSDTCQPSCPEAACSICVP